MNSYQKIGWLDHVEDVETGEVIQEGTPVSQTNMKIGRASCRERV